MVLQVNYEVQVQQYGRWSIHARFEGNQRDPSIEEGRQLDKLPSIDAVKVIKEVFDTDKETTAEFVVFKSASLKSGASKDSGGGGGGGGYSRESSAPSENDSWLSDDDDFEDFEKPRRGKKTGKKQQKSSTMTSVIVKLLMVILFSIMISAGVAMTVDGIMGGVRLFGIHFVGAVESNLLIGVFAITFLISVIGLSFSIMRGEKIESSGSGRRQQKPKKIVQRAPKAQAKKPAPAPKKKEANLGEAMKGVEDFKIEQVTETSKEAKEAKDTENKATADRLNAELNKDKEQPSDDPAGRGVVLDADTYGKKEAPPPEALSPQAEKQKAYMLNFLKQAMEGAQIDQKKMDNFNKFGVNLYLSGACEILSQKRDIDFRSRSKILADCVQVMGFKKSHAASFAERYEEYLMSDSRYMQMFQSGRNAMNIYFTDEPAGPRLLDNAMTEWNKPKPKEQEVGPVTVLFTDIAGSTAMTQALGDAGAQQVVRVHNRIVREALSAHAGKEVKHTGDGIMASFAKTSDGVEGAIQMQRECMVHNQATPDLPLHLKIGLNAGEPIAEDNDLFGTVVQLSARIVDKASADQIYVSEIVRGICAGKSYKFNNLGGFPMKGFGEDITLFEVIWNEAAPDGASPEAPAETPAETPQPAEAPSQSVESPTQ